MSASITTSDDGDDEDEEDDDEDEFSSTETDDITEDEESDSELDSDATTVTDTTLTQTTDTDVTGTSSGDETGSTASTVRRTTDSRSFADSDSTVTPYDSSNESTLVSSADDRASNHSTVKRRTTVTFPSLDSSATFTSESEDVSTEADDTSITYSTSDADSSVRMSSSRDKSSEDTTTTSYQYGSSEGASRSQSDSQQQPSSAYYGSGSYADDSTYADGSGYYGDGSGYYGSGSVSEVKQNSSVENPHRRYQPYYDRGGANDSYEKNSDDRLNSVEPIDKVLNDLSVILKRGQSLVKEQRRRSAPMQQRSPPKKPPAKNSPPPREAAPPPTQQKSILRPSRSMSREAKQQVSFGKISKSTFNPRPSATLRAVKSRPVATSVSDFHLQRRKGLSASSNTTAAFISLHSTTLIIAFWATLSYLILSNCFFNDCGYYYLNNNSNDPASGVSVSTFNGGAPGTGNVGVKGWTTVSGRQDSRFYSPARHFYYSTTPADQRPACPFGYLHCGENNNNGI